MILDYRDYITEKGRRGIMNYSSYNSNEKLFNHDSICPFCKCKIDNEVFYNSYSGYPGWLDGSYEEVERVIQCPVCGWWEYIFRNQSDALSEGMRASDIVYKSAILKKYNDNSKDVPLELVKEAVKKNSDILCSIHHSKMEDLVRSVLNDFYPGCKVYHFGRTKDGGKDGLLVDDNGKQFLIQVKRRTKLNSTESVKPIRELLGVSVLEDNINGCIFVSSAKKYSKEAIKTAQLAEDKRIVDKYELINREEFFKYVDLTTKDLPRVWEKLLTVEKTKKCFEGAENDNN